MTVPTLCGQGAGLSPDQEVGTGDRSWPFSSGFPPRHQDTPLGEELKPPTLGVWRLEPPLPSPPQGRETFGPGLTWLSRTLGAPACSPGAPRGAGTPLGV